MDPRHHCSRMFHSSLISTHFTQCMERAEKKAAHNALLFVLSFQLAVDCFFSL